MILRMSYYLRTPFTFFPPNHYHLQVYKKIAVAEVSICHSVKHYFSVRSNSCSKSIPPLSDFVFSCIHRKTVNVLALLAENLRQIGMMQCFEKEVVPLNNYFFPAVV